MFRLHGLFYLLTLLSINSTTSHARLIDRTAAIVNDRVITLSDVTKYRAQKQIRAELDPFVVFFKFKPNGLKEEIDYLIQEQLIIQKIDVELSDVDKEIQGVLSKNNITEAQLSAILSNQGTTLEIYKELMKVSLAKRKLLDRELRPLAFVTDDEIRNFYYTQSEFLKRKKEQKLVLSYSLSQLSTSSADQANSIYVDLKSGQAFDEVRQKYTEEGAEYFHLGQIEETELAGVLRSNLEGLKTNQFTKPIKLGSNYVILKIDDLSAPKDPIFERMKPQIHARLYQNALQKQLEIWTLEAKRTSYIHIP